MADDTVLSYDDIFDFLYNPFTDSESEISIVDEYRTVPASPPYQIKLFHAPVEHSPTTTTVEVVSTSTLLNEVGVGATPNLTEFHVQYEPRGIGILEVNSALAGLQLKINYKAKATILQKSALDTRVPASGNTTIAGNKTFTGNTEFQGTVDGIDSDGLSTQANPGDSETINLIYTGDNVIYLTVVKPITCCIELTSVISGGLSLDAQYDNSNWYSKEYFDSTGEYVQCLNPGYYRLLLVGSSAVVGNFYLLGAFGKLDVTDKTGIYGWDVNP